MTRFGDTVVLFAERAVDLADMPNTHHLDWDGEGREVELDDARTV